MNVLSLFSGLGGWEQAWPLSWDVATVDWNADLNIHRKEGYNMEPFDYVLDLSLPSSAEAVLACILDRGWDHVDLVIASPPCYEFYKATFPTRWNQKPGDEDTSMSEGCLRTTHAVIQALGPRYWLVENTNKGRPWVEEVFGPVRQIIGAYHIWSNMPLLSAEVEHKIAGQRDPRHSPIRSNLRARIPHSLSKAVRVAMLEQTTLTELLFHQSLQQ